MARTKQRPIPRKIRAKQRQLRHNQEHYSQSASSAPTSAIFEAPRLTARHERDDVADGIEEEEMRVGVDLDQHHDARGDDGQQADDVHDADAVEDDVARAGEGLGRESHSVGGLELGSETVEALAFVGNVDESASGVSCLALCRGGGCLYLSVGQRRRNMWRAQRVGLVSGGCPAVWS